MLPPAPQVKLADLNNQSDGSDDRLYSDEDLGDGSSEENKSQIPHSQTKFPSSTYNARMTVIGEDPLENTISEFQTTTRQEDNSVLDDKVIALQK